MVPKLLKLSLRLPKTFFRDVGNKIGSRVKRLCNEDAGLAMIDITNPEKLGRDVDSSEVKE